MLSLSTPAPAFPSPESIAGKWVVLYFYPKDDTPGCTKEACGFRDCMTELQRMGVVVYGVSADSAESHEAFTKKYNLNFPLIADTSGAIRSAYQAEKRCTYVIDPQGMIANVYLVHNPEEHPLELLEDMQDMVAE
jgi:peroxiredoxin Q/BCP